MPPIARELLNDLDDCVIIEKPKKSKKRKAEKTKYDRGYYADKLKQEKNDEDIIKQWKRRAEKK
jgi:hypothetical protein